MAAVSPSTLVADTHLNIAELALAQRACPEVLSAGVTDSLSPQVVKTGEHTVVCDVSNGRCRPIVPSSQRRSVFQAIHGIAHPGVRATRRLVAARFTWRGLSSDIGKWCKECADCERAKVTKQPAAPLAPFPEPARRFAHVHLDIVGPLPVSAAGFTHILTMIDRSTRYLEAVPLKSTSTEACLEAFTANWLARFGVPARLTTDRGVQFTSHAWDVFCKALGIDHIMTTAYHPQAHGMIERTHRQLKDALRARLAGVSWPEHLPWVLLGLRAAPKEISDISSAELVHGSPLVLPGQFVDIPEPPAESFLEALRAVPAVPQGRRSYAEAASMANLPDTLRVASHVYVRRGQVAPPLTPLYQGPYRVVERGPKVFKLDLGGREDTVSVDRLKPHRGEAEVVEARAPRRGRPPLASVGSPDLPLPESALGGVLWRLRTESNVGINCRRCLCYPEENPGMLI